MSELATMPRHGVGESASAGSVLIIDDEAAIRESLETLLEMEGYSVQSAATADEGLTRIGSRPYDLVLLDLALPDRNGIDLLAERHHDHRLWHS
jgi:DNA-binding response OmpR family regulator